MQTNSRLKELRRKLGLTQVDMAEFLGVTVATYSRYEKGLFRLDAGILCKLADYYGVSVDYILLRTNDPRMYKVNSDCDIEFAIKYANLDDYKREILAAVVSAIEEK